MHAAGGGEGGAPAQPPMGVQQLVDTLLERVRLPTGDSCNTSSGSSSSSKSGQAKAEPFLFYIDHCFAIKGQGTVMTGRCCLAARVEGRRSGTCICVRCRPPAARNQRPTNALHACRHSEGGRGQHTAVAILASNPANLRPAVHECLQAR